MKKEKINLYVTTEEKELIEKKAQEENRKITNYVYNIVMTHIKKE